MILGYQPNKLTVHLTDGADFAMTLNLVDPDGTTLDWPTGAVLALVFEGQQEWAAVVTGQDAVWSVDKDVAGQVRDRSTVRLRYTNGDTDEVWAIGKVERHG